MTLLYQLWLFLYWTTTLTITVYANFLPGCEFPQEWQGEWNVEGERESSHISIEDFGTKGFCLKEENDIYVIYNRNTECHHCITFLSPHPNVLQIREGPCQFLQNGEDEVTSVTDFCQEFVEAPIHLQTLVRLSGPPIDCPFTGEFTFTYKTGQQSCRNPVSHVDRCMDSTQIAFNFAKCPTEQTDSRDTILSQIIMESQENGAETLTCKGMWTGPAETQFQPFQNDEEDSNEYVVDDDSEDDDPPAKTVNYLVGILDEPFLTRVNDKVKCFIYQETAKGGYRLAQSADASCRGLVNVRKDGYRTLHLKPYTKEEEPQELCTFPYWATDIGVLHSFALTSQYTFSEDLSTMTMANYSHLSKEAFPSSVAVCQKIVEQLTQVDYVRLIVKVTAQCETKYKCINMFGRTEDIIEIQEGNLVDNMDSACSVENMDDDNLPFTTLINAEVPTKPCTNGGNYNVTELSLKGQTELCNRNGFNQVSIRCRDDVMIQFLRECSNEVKDSEFLCIGGWEEFTPTIVIDYPYGASTYHDYSGYNFYEEHLDFPVANATIGYLIARPKVQAHKAPQRVCLIYTNLNDTYFWTVDPTSCPRKIKPGVAGIFKFNTTKIETCGSNLVTSSIKMAFIWLSILLLR